MEWQGSGSLRLPPGFRFHPTDEELVVQYLKRKALSFPLPASVIPEIDLRNYDPWDLPGGNKEEQYYFNLRGAKNRRIKGSNRVACSGYWKTTGRKDNPIYSSNCKQVVGMKRVLVFYKGKYPNGSPTQWTMHEYSLADCHPKLCNFVNDWKDGMEDWVVCRIFKKRLKKEAKNQQSIDNDISWLKYTELSDAHSHSLLSSSSSCVTDVSEDGDEGNSNSKSFTT